MTRRFAWQDIETFPGNPILETRLDQMIQRWGGYIPEAVGVPLVADNSAGAFPEYPGDAVVMVNGHHRQALALRYDRGKDEVTCELLRGYTRKQLHLIFRQVNDNRNISHAEKFMHRIGQGEAKVLAIVDVMEREGFKPSSNGRTGEWGEGIYSTQAIEWVWDGGDAALRKRRGNGPHRDALTLALRGYKVLTEGKKLGKQGTLLKGLGAFYIRYPDADPDRLMERLTAAFSSPDRLMDAAKMAKEDYRLPNNHEAFGFIARLQYNGSRRGRHTLPEWRS